MEDDKNENPFAVSYARIADTESLDDSAPTSDTTVAVLTDEPLNNGPIEIDNPEPEIPTVGVGEEIVPQPNGVAPEIEGEVTEPEIKVNPYFAAQRHLLEEGLITEEDLNVEATWDDISTVFESRVEERIKSNVAKQLEEDGHTEETLMYARMIGRGVDPQSLQPVNQMHQIASLKGREDLTAEQKEAVIESMYRFRKLPPEEYKVLISNAKSKLGENPELFENLYNSSIDYHETSFNQIKQAESAESKKLSEARRQAEIESTQQVKEILTTRKIDDLVFSKDQEQNLRSAIYNRDTVFEYQGGEQRGTKMDAFLANLYSSDKMKIKAYLLMNDPEGLKKVAKEKAKLSIVDDIIKASNGVVVKKDTTKDKKQSETEYTAKAAREY